MQSSKTSSINVDRVPLPFSAEIVYSEYETMRDTQLACYSSEEKDEQKPQPTLVQAISYEMIAHSFVDLARGYGIKEIVFKDASKRAYQATSAEQRSQIDEDSFDKMAMRGAMLATRLYPFRRFERSGGHGMVFPHGLHEENKNDPSYFVTHGIEGKRSILTVNLPEGFSEKKSGSLFQKPNGYDSIWGDPAINNAYEKTTCHSQKIFLEAKEGMVFSQKERSLLSVVVRPVIV